MSCGQLEQLSIKDTSSPVDGGSASNGESAETCVKCKSSRSTVSVRGSHFCNACFEINLGARFRNHLAKIPSVEPREGVSQADSPKNKTLIGLSGGSSSITLLSLVCQYGTTAANGTTNATTSTKGSRAGRRLGQVIACYIDESVLNEDLVVNGDIPSSTIVEQQELQKLADGFGIQLHVVKLETIFDITSRKDLELQCSRNGIFLNLQSQNYLEDTHPTARERLRTLFASVTPNTREILLQIFKQQLLLHTASLHGCNVVLLGTNADRMAIQTISLVAKGYGAQVPELFSNDPVSFVHSDVHMNETNGQETVKEIRIVRPLRDTMLKEVMTYMDIKQLPTIHSSSSPSLESSSSETSSSQMYKNIDHLTTTFITNLQRDFGGTVNTVVRTAARIPPPPHSHSYSQVGAQDITGTCVMCCHPLEQDRSWRKNRTVNTSPRSHTVNEPPSHNIDKEEFMEYLCYGCQNISLDIKKESLRLPGYVRSMVERQRSQRKVVGRQEMQNEIEEYLIRDDEDDRNTVEELCEVDAQR